MTDTSTNAELEIELAYLPKRLSPDLLASSPTRIVDMYLSTEDDLLTNYAYGKRERSTRLPKR